MMCEAKPRTRHKKQRVEDPRLARDMRVRLENYDWIVVNISGGKCSTAMLDEVCRQARRAGLLDRVVAVYADLKRMAWEGTKELVEEQTKHYGVRLIVCSRPQGDLLSHVKQRRKWPSSACRYCTSDHKRGQVSVVVNALCAETRARPGWKKGRRVRVLNCLGMRAEESPARSKLLPFRLDVRQSGSKKKYIDTDGREKFYFKPSKTKLVHTWLAVHRWVEEEVWNRIRQAGVRTHFVYSLGIPRHSCKFCIFMPKAALMRAGKQDPKLLDEYIDVQQEIGHKFRIDLDLVEVRDAINRGEEPEPVKTWAM
jgi:3'-phosphoadenosine 5'-phosphosulfate sulfotransferase (PAPS reductase)/FAD synthetase